VYPRISAPKPHVHLSAEGKSLLVLLPSERDAMLQRLRDAKVPVKQIKVNPGRAAPVGPALQALLSKDVQLKARSRVAAALALHLLSSCRRCRPGTCSFQACKRVAAALA
jgi:hypothetical protein